MKNKDLLKQLNTLKDIKPDSKWKDENRGVLMNQIYGAQATEGSHEFSLFKSFMKTLPRYAAGLAGQPAMVVVFILVFVFGSSAVGVKFAHNTKPGDSLYIAKIMSERTKEVLTFDDKEKAQLVIRHAQNRADELNQVLAESDYNDGEAERLVGDFQKHLQKAKTKLEKMNTAIAVDSDNKSEEDVDVKEGEIFTEEKEDEPQEVFSVNSGKDDSGMQVIEKNNATVDNEPGIDIDDSEVIDQEDDKDGEVSPSDILKEAGELLVDDDYSATLDKLVEANDAIEKSIIKEDVALSSSTEDVIEEEIASSTKDEME
jgi:hypothetical protein